MLDTLSMAELLKGDYKKAFEKIDLYGSINNVNHDVFEDRILNLYDMLTEAQNEGKPVEKIIGKDIEAFCKEYFKVPEKNYTFVKVLGRIAYLLLIMFIFSIIELLWQIEEGKALMEMQVDMIPFFVGVGIGLILLVLCKLATKNMVFKNNKIKPTFYYVFILIFIVAGVVILNKAFNDYSVSLPLMPVLIISGIYSLLYYGIRAIVRYKTTGRITKLSKEDKAERKEFDEDVAFRAGVKDSAEILAKRFTKLKKKKEKKGIAYTYKDFTKVIVDEAKNGGITNVIIILICAVGVIVPGVKMFIADGMMEGALYLGMMGAIQFFVARFVIKILDQAYKENLHVLKECEERGIDVIEYDKLLKEMDGEKLEV